MSERIRGSYDDALYKSTYTLLYLHTLLLAGGIPPPVIRALMFHGNTEIAE